MITQQPLLSCSNGKNAHRGAKTKSVERARYERILWAAFSSRRSEGMAGNALQMRKSRRPKRTRNSSLKQLNAAASDASVPSLEILACSSCERLLAHTTFER